MTMKSVYIVYITNCFLWTMSDNKTPITVSESEVYFILKSINTNKATGPDKLSGRIIKQCVTSLVPIIHTIFNNSIEQCVMPAPKENW